MGEPNHPLKDHTPLNTLRDNRKSLEEGCPSQGKLYTQFTHDLTLNYDLHPEKNLNMSVSCNEIRLEY